TRRSSDLLTASDPRFAAAIRDVATHVAAVPVVTGVRDPLDPANADQISADRHSAIVRFNIRGDPNNAEKKIDPVLAAVDKVKARHPQLFVGEFGDASASK